MSHTKEPTGYVHQIEQQRDELLASVTAQRDTAWAEANEIREAIQANPEESTADEVRRVVSQRDELLAALKDLHKAYRMAVGLHSGQDDAYTVRSHNAIAKVKS